MTKRLRRSFALNRYDEPESAKCPGEEKCGKFAIAKSEGESGLEACANCELLPTKPGQNSEMSDEEARYEKFFAICFDVRARARLNGEIDGSRITTLQYEMTVIAEGLIENFEREAEARARIAQEENSKLITDMLKALGRFRF